MNICREFEEVTDKKSIHQYQPFEHIGFGAGYDYVSGDVDYKDGDDKTSVDASYYGPSLFVTLIFL